MLFQVNNVHSVPYVLLRVLWFTLFLCDGLLIAALAYFSKVHKILTPHANSGLERPLCDPPACVGFSFQTSPRGEVAASLAIAAVRHGARAVLLYDTRGLLCASAVSKALCQSQCGERARPLLRLVGDECTTSCSGGATALVWLLRPGDACLGCCVDTLPISPPEADAVFCILDSQGNPCLSLFGFPTNLVAEAEVYQLSSSLHTALASGPRSIAHGMHAYTTTRQRRGA